MRLLRVSLALTIILIGTSFTPARADYPVRIMNGSTVSPVQITRCKILGNYGSFIARLTLVNRTRYQLLGFNVTFVAYDTANFAIGSTGLNFYANSPNWPQKPGASENYSWGPQIGITLSEPENVLAHFTCFIQNAQFTGGHQWASGQRWPEVLGSPR